MGLWDKLRRSQQATPTAKPGDQPPTETLDDSGDPPEDDAVPYGGLSAAQQPGSSTERESWAALEARIAEALAGLQEGEFLLIEAAADQDGFVQFLQTGDLLVGECAGWTSAAVMAELGWQPTADRHGHGLMGIDRDPQTSDPLTASSGASLATSTLRAGLGWRIPEAVELELG